MAKRASGRPSYIAVVSVIGPTIPSHRSTPIAAPRPAVFALRQMHTCARTNAITRFSRNVTIYGSTGFTLFGVGPSSAIHGLVKSTAYHKPPTIQYTTAQTTTAA